MIESVIQAIPGYAMPCHVSYCQRSDVINLILSYLTFGGKEIRRAEYSLE